MAAKENVPPPGKVAIIGFGLMGAQIAQVFSMSGYDVSCYDLNPDQLKKGLDLVQNGRYGLKRSQASGRLGAAEAELAFKRITPENSIEKATSGAEIVLEAAIEDLLTKREIIARASLAADGVLASNTSTILISKIAEGLESKTRKRLLGMHFFNPPQVMKLVEVVKTSETTAEAIQKIEDAARKLGKIPIIVSDTPGFVANRIGISVFAEASSLLEKKIASVEDIDTAMRLGYGYPMGPFELGDLVGLDARLKNMEALYNETRDERFKPPETLKKLVLEGFLGDPKTKEGSRGGYYEYFGQKRPEAKKQ